MGKRRKRLILFIIALTILMFVFIDHDAHDWTENWGNYLGIVTGIFLVSSLLFSNTSSKNE
jgi:cell division protein FtsW (lipid II flippase)